MASEHLTCIRSILVKDRQNRGRRLCGRGNANHEDETGRRLCGKCFSVWFRKRFKYHPSMEDWYHYHTGPGHSDYEVYADKEHRYSDDQSPKHLTHAH